MSTDPSSSKDFPGFDNIFYMSDPITDRAYRGNLDAEVGEQHLFTRAEAVPSGPVIITHARGERQPEDVFWTNTAVMMIVSQHIIDILLDNRFTGWSTYPVEVYSREGSRVPGYYGLSVTGRCGILSPSMNDIKLEEFPGGWFPCFNVVFFDPESWDGSHFFKEAIDTTSGTGLAGIFVTSEVWAAFHQAGVKNVRMECLNDMSIAAPIYEVKNRQGLPADYMERLAVAYKEAGVPIPERYTDLPL